MKYFLSCLILLGQLAMASNELTLLGYNHEYEIYIDDKYTNEIVENSLYDIRFYFMYKVDNVDMGYQEFSKIKASDFDMNYAFVDCKGNYFGIYSFYSFDKDNVLKGYSEPVELKDINMYLIDSNTSIAYHIANHICQSKEIL